jgi:hypothetical protein
MRTTVELPDDLMKRARSSAALAGISLREFFIDAVESKIEGARKKVRRPPPMVGSPRGPRIGVLTAEQVDEAVFG